MRKYSVVAPDWWDYTTIDDELVRDTAKLTVKDMEQLSRPGFKVVMYDTIEEFYLAEALEYIEANFPATERRDTILTFIRKSARGIIPKPRTNR